MIIYNNVYWGFPGGPVVMNPPSNAGEPGSIPGQRTKIPHATGQLSLRALEPARHNYRARALQLWSPRVLEPACHS